MAVAAIMPAIRRRGLRPAATTAAVTRPYIRAASASNGTGSNSLSARCRVSVRDRHHHRLAVCRRDRPARRPGPKLRWAVRDAKKAGYAYVVLDGTLIPIDRVAADRPFYSGKHRKHGMNLQVIASPDGDILWVSGALPGSVHDKKAEWVWGVLAELEAAGLVTLADKGYQGSTYAKIPYKGKNKPQSQKDANKAHARLRSPGERANAKLKTWRILRKLRCCPWRAGQLAKVIHVLQIREAYAG